MKITDCRKCPRLVSWREEVARKKRKQFQDWNYHGKPVPSFGNLQASLLIVGLAPAAHGANRTGRMFTGDRSGLWLYRALHKAGLCNQFSYEKKNDGLKLIGTRITAVVHCAPPLNKPTMEEKNNCLPYLVDEIKAMKQLRSILCLGKFAWDGALEALAKLGHTQKPKPKFGHQCVARLGPYKLVGSYHPSQQNTFTGRVTEEMFDGAIQTALEK